MEHPHRRQPPRGLVVLLKRRQAQQQQLRSLSHLLLKASRLRAQPNFPRLPLKQLHHPLSTAANRLRLLRALPRQPPLVLELVLYPVARLYLRRKTQASSQDDSKLVPPTGRSEVPRPGIHQHPLLVLLPLHTQPCPLSRFHRRLLALGLHRNINPANTDPLALRLQVLPATLGTRHDTNRVQYNKVHTSTHREALLLPQTVLRPQPQLLVQLDLHPIRSLPCLLHISSRTTVSSV